MWNLPDVLAFLLVVQLPGNEDKPNWQWQPVIAMLYYSQISAAANDGIASFKASITIVIKFA